MNIKKVWDTFTDKYSYLPVHPQYFLKRYDKTAVSFALKYAHGILVDIGCGRMPYRNRLEAKVTRYIGVDSPATSGLYQGSKKPDFLADATKLPFKKTSCDIVLLLMVIEHLPNPEKALKEIHRILKPGGILILSTAQTYPLHDKPFDFYRFTEYGLKYLLTNSGFEIIKHQSEGNIFVNVSQQFNLYIMVSLKEMLGKKSTKLLAYFLIIPFLLLTTLSNLLTFFFLPLDKNSNFTMFHTIAAKRISR